MRLLKGAGATLAALENRVFNRADAADAEALIAFLDPWFEASLKAARKTAATPPAAPSGRGAMAA
jgi:hypothetical protein